MPNLAISNRYQIARFRRTPRVTQIIKKGTSVQASNMTSKLSSDSCGQDTHRIGAVFKKTMKSVCFWLPFFFAIWDHLEEFLRCGDLKLRCVRFGETAWHVSCDLGLRCETALRSAAICVARCEIAKLSSLREHGSSEHQDSEHNAPGVVC